MRSALLALVLAVAARGAPPAQLVLTSFQPLYSFACAVAKGSAGIEVQNLAPRALGPHDFKVDAPEHAARCRALVQRATALLTLRTVGVAPEFDRLYPWSRELNVRIVEVDPLATWKPGATKLPLIADPPDTARAREAGKPRDRINNPHVWLSLSHAIAMVGAVAHDFALLDPPNAALYAANAAAYQDQLRELRRDASARLQEADDRVASLTEGFPYLTADLGLEVADYILDPKSDAEISARVKAAAVRVVLAEEPPAKNVAAAVEAAGAKVVVLSTLEEGWGTGDALSAGGYLEAMRANVERLAGAITH